MGLSGINGTSVVQHITKALATCDFTLNRLNVIHNLKTD